MDVRMLLLFEWRLYDYGALGDQALSNDIDVLNSDKITAIINNTRKTQVWGMRMT